ncbi:unnamed protein product, partial [Cyprideis torosa]
AGVAACVEEGAACEKKKEEALRLSDPVYAAMLEQRALAEAHREREEELSTQQARALWLAREAMVEEAILERERQRKEREQEETRIREEWTRMEAERLERQKQQEMKVRIHPRLLTSSRPSG